MGPCDHHRPVVCWRAKSCQFVCHVQSTTSEPSRAECQAVQGRGSLRLRVTGACSLGWKSHEFKWIPLVTQLGTWIGRSLPVLPPQRKRWLRLLHRARPQSIRPSDAPKQGQSKTLCSTRFRTSPPRRVSRQHCCRQLSIPLLGSSPSSRKAAGIERFGTFPCRVAEKLPCR